ncbi:MAG: NYN domain-containing protein [Chloroflexi bacterium]|nr:NYN domain-containing protein [Chloroflexota bacterium]
MPYLIDGHNLIECLPDIELDDPNDEAQLVNKLKGFAAMARKKCIVVFDHGLPGGHSSMSTRSVQVIFAAARHKTADDLIKSRISRTEDAPNWTLVSADRDVVNYAHRHRMRHMSSAQFAQLLGGTGLAEETRGEEIHPTVSAEEIDELYQAFGGELDC